MRILHIVDYLNYGGLQQVVIGLAHGLKHLGHHVEIVCIRKLGNHPEAVTELEAAGIPVMALSKPGGFRTLPDALARLVRHMKASKFDVVHSHNPLAHHWAVVAGRLAGIPLTMNTVHAMLIFNKMSRSRRALFWGAALQSDRIISVCTEVRDFTKERYWLPASKMAVIENGIVLDSFLALPLRPLGREVVFGTVGRVAAVKNHRLMIQAFHLLRQKYPNVRLRILGGGSMVGELKTLTSDLGIEGDVTFCGYGHDVAAFLSSLDVFVLSSISEGLPLSLLEAIAAGLPSIVTAVGGMPDVIEKTSGGWVCPSGDAPAMMLAMEQALLDQDRTQRQIEARKRVASEYSVERMTENHVKLYEECLKK